MTQLSQQSDYSFSIVANGAAVSSIKIVFSINNKAIALFGVPVGINVRTQQDAAYAFDVGKKVKIYYINSLGGTKIFHGTVCAVSPYVDINSDKQNGYYIAAHGHLGTLMSGTFLSDIFSPQAFRDISSQAWTAEPMSEIMNVLKTPNFGRALIDLCKRMLESPISGIGAKVAEMQQKSIEKINEVLNKHTRAFLLFDSALTDQYLEGLAKNIISLLINDFYKTSIGDKLVQLGHLMHYNVLDTPNCIWFVPRTALYRSDRYRSIIDFDKLNVITGNESLPRYSGCLVVTSTNNAQTEGIEAQQHVLGEYVAPEPWNEGQPIIWPLPDFFSKTEQTSSGIVIEKTEWDLPLLNSYAMHLYWLTELVKYKATVEVPYFRTDLQIGTPVKVPLVDNPSLRYVFKDTVYGIIDKITLTADVNAQTARTVYELSYCRTRRQNNQLLTAFDRIETFTNNPKSQHTLVPYGGFWREAWSGSSISGAAFTSGIDPGLLVETDVGAPYLG